MSEIMVPVAYCKTCDERGPVVVESIDDLGFDFTAIFCPGCSQIINVNGDVEVTYYEPSELEKATGWKVSNAGTN